MNERGVDNPEGQKFKLKISGDGARFSRTSSFTLLSFAFLNTGREVLSSAGHRTFAVVKGGEDYDIMKESLQVVWTEINDLIKKGSVDINGTNVEVEVFFSGDYKFLLMAMGLNKASSN